MIALEAIRMTLVTIDNDLHSLEICIKEADGMIDINYGFIETNQRSIQWNTEEVEIQNRRLETLQWQCRKTQEQLD